MLVHQGLFAVGNAAVSLGFGSDNRHFIPPL